jgi:hypothetical protein
MGGCKTDLEPLIHGNLQIWIMKGYPHPPLFHDSVIDGQGFIGQRFRLQQIRLEGDRIFVGNGHEHPQSPGFRHGNSDQAVPVSGKPNAPWMMGYLIPNSLVILVLMVMVVQIHKSQKIDGHS